MTASAFITGPSCKHKIDFLLSPLAETKKIVSDSSTLSSVSNFQKKSPNEIEDDRSNAAVLLMLHSSQEKKDTPFVFRKRPSQKVKNFSLDKKESHHNITAGHAIVKTQEDTVDNWIVALRAQTYCYVLNEASTDDEKRYKCLFDSACNKKIKGKGNLR
jgi:hypothetical protein